MSTFIVLEGADGSGKATQTKLLAGRLREHGYKVRELDFPRYEEEGSTLVRMYLRGDFGKHADTVSPYAAATAFAMDRYASYQTDWNEDYLGDTILLADRYTTSNMVHQTVKLAYEERETFLHWLLDYEYQKLGLPVPDYIFFLDMETEVSQRLIEERRRAIGERQDIHEEDASYLDRVHTLYREMAVRYGWQRIACTNEGRLLPIEEIQAKLWEKTSAFLHL